MLGNRRKYGQFFTDRGARQFFEKVLIIDLLGPKETFL